MPILKKISQADDGKTITILEAFDGAKKGLTKDSIAAIIALENDIEDKAVLLKRLKEGSITAVYNGDKTQGGAISIDGFVFNELDGKNDSDAKEFQ